jgi:DNA-nicking Smr family endonuclease
MRWLGAGQRRGSALSLPRQDAARVQKAQIGRVLNHMTGDQEDSEIDGDIPIELPIDGVLDLHTFQPREVKELVPDYLDECRERGIFEVRIIHGKGTGALRRSVHAILSRLPEVASFGLAMEDAGGWGATLVRLRAPAEEREQYP